MIFGSKILCPFCFNEVAMKDLYYRCSSSSCLEPGTAKIHIIRNGKADRNGYCTCDSCGKTTSTRVCSKCESALPYSITEGETEIISIVGAKGSGKSYYVATLLRQIMEKGLFSRINGASAKWGVKESAEEYAKRFKKRMDTFVPLDGTQKVTDIVKDNPPLLVEMTFEKKKGFGSKNTIKTFSFFDAAGESFEDAADLAAVTPYIAHSKAVVLILDPRQIQAVDDAVKSYMPGLPAVSSKSYSDIINNVIEVIRNSLRIKANDKIKIPLCVAFSKWDLLVKTPGLLPDGLIVSQQNQQNTSGYDDDLVNTASEEIRSLLMNWEPNLVATAEGKFETVRYFGFSAWGFANTKANEIPPIASYRVEDPMLWALHQEGIV